MPRFAAIDVGSNALRLRVVEASAPSQRRRRPAALLPDPERRGPWRDLATLRAPVRLGAEVFLSGRLAPASIGQACDGPARVPRRRWTAGRSTPTAPSRRAPCGRRRTARTLVERARREAGIELETIEGIEEARLIQLAVTRRLPLGDKRALLVDVGGGSTELTLVERGETAFTMSLPLGTVRMLEAYLKGVKTVDRARERLLEEAIDRALGEALPQLGTVDVARRHGRQRRHALRPLPGQGHAARDRRRRPPRRSSRRCARCPTASGATRTSSGPDRADTIVPATAIFLRLGSVLKIDDHRVAGRRPRRGRSSRSSSTSSSTCGTRRARPSASSRPARASAAATTSTRRTRGTCAASRRSSSTICSSVHAFGERDRLLLRAAAMLHDIGDYVHYSGHHKHSQYLIQHADIMGITPEERAIVANIARYHRKGPPDPSHPGYRDLDKEARGKVRGPGGASCASPTRSTASTSRRSRASRAADGPRARAA